jgi:WD40 repeat protein
MFWERDATLPRWKAELLLVALDRRSLLRLEGERPERQVSLHDLQHDFVRGTCGDLTARHSDFLDSYDSKCEDGWPSGPNDGYYFEHLAYHLKEANKPSHLKNLLLNYHWLQAKLQHTDILQLLADFDHLPNDEDTTLLQEALRLSAHFLARDKNQLPSQIHGRLLGVDSPAIRESLSQTKTTTPWLRPLTPTLTPPGGPLRRTLEGHSSGVNGVAITRDGSTAVSASSDHTLKVWDLHTGELQRTLQGHSNGVSGVAITPDGSTAVSASYDHTLKVWDLQSGDVVMGFAADWPLYCCCVSPSGTTIVAGDRSGQVHFLRLENLSSG